MDTRNSVPLSTTFTPKLVFIMATSLLVLSFLALAVAVGGYNGAIEKVIAIDVVTLAILTIGVVVRSYAPAPRPD